MGQLSFFSADAHPRALTDLEGVLCAPARLSFFGARSAARLTVPLGVGSGAAEPDALRAWRAHALRCAFRARGVEADVVDVPVLPGIGENDGPDAGGEPATRPELRSAFRRDLAALARSWGPDPSGAARTLPPGFELDGPRLRLWVLAAGRREGRAYVLGLDPGVPATHGVLLAPGRPAGLAAEPDDDPEAPGLRIGRVRAKARLAELVGARPRSVHDGVWPV